MQRASSVRRLFALRNVFSSRKILNRRSVTLFPEDSVKQALANPRNAPTKESSAESGVLRVSIFILALPRIHRQAWPSRESLRLLSLSLSLSSSSFSLSLPPFLSRFSPGSGYAAPVGPCNQSFNSYCTRKRIIRRCCVLYDEGRNTHRSSASKMATHRVARVQRNNTKLRARSLPLSRFLALFFSLSRLFV